MRHELKMAVAALGVLGAMTMTGCAHTSRSSSMDTGLAAVPDTFEARRKLASELMARGDWQPAFAYIDQLHRERPNDAGVLVLRATVYREQNLLDEAEADLRDAVRLAPQLASARAALGILFDMQRKPEKAEEQLRLAAKLEPENPVYLNNLGFSLFLHGKTKEAITFYEKAARLAPATRRTRTNLGFACAAQGDWHRAAREFALGGTPVEAKVNLGFAYEQHGDLANAYDLYVQATHLDPHSQRARTNLVHVADLLGRPAPGMPDDPAPAAPALRDDGTAVTPQEVQP
ncbi:MAG TPA: tetratricopeptide repeat protein [Burkholderiaceae bacterium]|nr:tetratricopeptide repeat protein [Burkholderiaceae bacterium]